MMILFASSEMLLINLNNQENQNCNRNETEREPAREAFIGMFAVDNEDAVR